VTFNPCNRHLLIKEKSNVAENNDKPVILVPDDYNVKISPYGIYEVINVADDCIKFDFNTIKKNILVNSNMVEEVKIEGADFLLVLENHVYGTFK